MEFLLLYAIFALENLSLAGIFITILALVILGVATIFQKEVYENAQEEFVRKNKFYSEEKEMNVLEENRNMKKQSYLNILKFFKIAGALFILSASTNALIPSDKQVVKIIAGGLVLKMANNEQISALPENLAKYVNEYLKKED